MENCLIENSNNDKIPMIIVTMAIDVPSVCPTPLKPYTIPPNPTVDRRIDNKSIFGLVIVETFCI
ncbi:hypothetical protein J14TS2_21500 [Bacillus sp. J14TS2]|nr:hypothetical protein J14TS2_21500 [Bacillus sp. J14TS2]